MPLAFFLVSVFGETQWLVRQDSSEAEKEMLNVQGQSGVRMSYWPAGLPSKILCKAQNSTVQQQKRA